MPTFKLNQRARGLTACAVGLALSLGLAAGQAATAPSPKPKALQVAAKTAMPASLGGAAAPADAALALQEVAPPADLSPALKEKYFTAASKFYQVGDIKVHVRDEGSGPVIVMLHGAMSSLQAWDFWAAELVKSYRVIRIDAPGNGLTGAYPSGAYTPDRIYDTLATLLNAMHLQHMTLVANSLGGYYASRYAADHSQSVERMVLLAPAAYPAKLPSMLTYYVKNNEGEVIPAVVPPSLYVGSFKQMYGDISRIRPGVMERYQELTQQLGNRKSNLELLRYLKEFGKDPQDYASKQPPFVKQLKMPVLIMWGHKDRMLTDEQAQLWKRDVPQAQIIIYPDAGHTVMEEIPELSLKDMLAFMQHPAEPSAVNASTK